MLYGILCALLAAGLVALDQLVKYWVQANIPVNTHVPFIPGLLDLTHVHNTGGAFSALADLTTAGAAGNLIDRVRLGYVVDMFATTFMDFAVFNVADICIVVGGIWFCLYYIFLHEREEGKGEDHGPQAASDR